jgi:hypothetical protein
MSITDQCPIDNGLFKSVTAHCRIGNGRTQDAFMLGCVSFAGDPIGYAHFLGLISFIATQGHLFFSHQRCALLLLVSVFSFRHHSLSLLRRPLPFRQQHLLYLLIRSLTQSLCLEVPVGLPRSPLPATCALRIALS